VRGDWHNTYTRSPIAMQTPSLVRASGDVAFVRRVDTISANTFSPAFRHRSPIVLEAVYDNVSMYQHGWKTMKLTSCCSNSLLDKSVMIWPMSSGKISLTGSQEVSNRSRAKEFGPLTSAGRVGNKSFPNVYRRLANDVDGVLTS